MAKATDSDTKRDTLLTDLAIQNAKPKEKDYLLKDGDWLFLNVKAIGSKVWTVRGKIKGKQYKTTVGNYYDDDDEKKDKRKREKAV